MRKTGVLIAAMLFAATIYRFVSGVMEVPVSRWDETTNALVVSESVYTKKLPFLYLNGSPFFEKPPLWYWAAAAQSYISLSSPQAIRIGSAVYGLAFVLLVVFCAYRRHGPLAAIITWIATLTTRHLFEKHPAEVFSSHTLWSADLDSLFLLFMFASYFFATARRQSAVTRMLSGISGGLAVLTKGPAGLLPLIVSARTSRIAWAAALITVLPWYALMSVRYGVEFWTAHTGYHLILRTLIPLEGHANPFWLYGFIIANPLYFPGFALFVIAVLLGLKTGTFSRDRALRHAGILALLYFLIPTFARTRLAWYIFPFYPFAAIITGAVLRDAFSYFSDKRL